MEICSTGRRAVKEDCGSFVLTTNSLTMEIIAVTKAMAWLESHGNLGEGCAMSGGFYQSAGSDGGS